MHLEMSDISVQLRYWKLLTTHHSNRCKKKKKKDIRNSSRLSLYLNENFFRAIYATEKLPLNYSNNLAKFP